MSRPLLAIDTSSGTSVALLNGGVVLAQVTHESGLKHAELIGDSIRMVLGEAGVKPAQVGAVAVARGPALFTGLRVGLAAATMFAAATGARLLGVVSHDALALQLFSEHEELAGAPLLVTTDARRGELYWSLYSGLDSHHLPNRIEGPAVGRREDILDQVAARSGAHGLAVERSGVVSAVWVAKLAETQLISGVASHEVSALYLRAPDAVEPKPNQMFGKRVSG